MNPLARLLLLCLLSLCSACTGPGPANPAPAQGEPYASVYVVNQGKHAGLILRRADIPPGFIPESADFPQADYLELGWGDWDYYQSGDPGLWLTLKAAFWPTASVLHLAGIEGGVAARYAGYEWIRLDLAPQPFAGLAGYVDRSFARHGAAKAPPIGPGHYGGSRFYPANGKFHIFHTCNGWLAGALAAAGYPMGWLEPVTADQLMATIRPFSARPEPE
jgi:uncharacterized protein (TIGR02117 family)